MPRPKTKAASYERQTLRLPTDVLTVLRQQAEAIGRPLNTHIIYVLRYGCDLSTEPPVPPGLQTP